MSEPKVNARDKRTVEACMSKMPESLTRYGVRLTLEHYFSAYREEIQAEMRDPAFDAYTTSTLRAQLSALRAELDRTIQAVEDALQGAGDEVIRELNADGCFSWPIITRKRIKELRAEVERLKGELATILSEVCGECPIEDAAADVITKHRGVVARVRELEGELAAEKARERYVPVQSLERLRSLPEKFWEASQWLPSSEKNGEERTFGFPYCDILARWARRYLRREVERG